MTARRPTTTKPDPDNPLRALLEALAGEVDRMSAHLDQVYEEAFIETAGEGGALTVRLDGPPAGRAYVVRRGADGAMDIEFGDGAEGRRPQPGSGGLTVEYRRGSGQVTVVPSGPVSGASPGRAAFGIYRATVVNADDPMGRRRLQVRVPAVTGDLAAWALPCLPSTTELPPIGDVVWVLFEGGDPDSPVWVGRL